MKTLFTKENMSLQTAVHMLQTTILKHI